MKFIFDHWYKITFSDQPSYYKDTEDSDVLNHCKNRIDRYSQRIIGQIDRWITE